MRSTKIICTIGPTCSKPEQIERLIRAGMNIARINLSHGTWEGHLTNIHTIQKISEKLNNECGMKKSIAILLDTQGAEIRTGVVDTPLIIEEGEEVIFSREAVKDSKRKVVSVNHQKFGSDAKQAESIIIDNGKLVLDIVEIQDDTHVVARARESGFIGSRRHVNLPGSNLSLPSLTDRDWMDIASGAAEGVDFMALSFIREAKEVQDVRNYLIEKKMTAKLIAKIETRQAVTNMEAIIDASDGIMVARGDLGAELPFETIPVIQDQLVRLARERNKPVIVATHMLESMCEDPMPTRAEVTDISHAVTTGADCTMLSGETASGKYPFLAFDAMQRVITSTEAHMKSIEPRGDAFIRSSRDARAEAAVRMIIPEVKAIVVLTRTGRTALEISRFRPSLPILAFTPDEHVQRMLQIVYGVVSVVTVFNETDPEQTVVEALEKALKLGAVQKGDQCVVVTDARMHEQNVSSIQLRKIN